jgi:Zn-dependent peptidase ImmA (M78 family)
MNALSSTSQSRTELEPLTAKVPPWLELRKEGVRKPAELYSRVLGKRAAQSSANVRLLCRKLGVELVEREISDDGACRFRTSEPYSAVIEVNRQASSARQNFTIAHELGHLLLHPETSNGWRRDLFSAAGTHKEEREANAFAAELLVPFAELRAWLDLLNVEMRVRVVTATMAKTYEISEGAARVRLDWAMMVV